MAIIHINIEEALRNNPNALQEVIDELINNANGLVDAEGGGEGEVAVDTATGEVTETVSGDNEILLYLYRYMHLRFSTSSNGSSFVDDPSMITGSTIYIGFNNNASSTAPTEAASYTWREFSWGSSWTVNYAVSGGRRIEVQTSATVLPAPFEEYTDGTGEIDLDNIGGVSAVNVVIFAAMATAGNTANWATFANTVETSPNFKNDTARVIGLFPKVFEGGAEWTTDQYTASGTEYSWKKNGLTFTPNEAQTSNTGTDKRVVLINQDDVSDGNMNEIFTVTITY